MIRAIHLTFRNLSSETRHAKICLFQRNLVVALGELPIAWKVIENCGGNDAVAFEFPLNLQVGAADSYNNVTPLLDAVPGQSFEVVMDQSGDMLMPLGQATRHTEVQIWNHMVRGACDARMYRGGNLLARKTGVYPGSVAAFEFKRSIWVGVVSRGLQGDVIAASELRQPAQELSLDGIASATIAMRGGGEGAQAQALTFTLEDVVKVR